MEYDPKILRQNPRAPHTSRWVRRRGSAGIVGGCIPSDAQDLGTSETSRAVLRLAIAGLSRVFFRLERALVLRAALAEGARERLPESARPVGQGSAPLHKALPDRSPDCLYVEIKYGAHDAEGEEVPGVG
jgi:hypothetical protein